MQKSRMILTADMLYHFCLAAKIDKSVGQEVLYLFSRCNFLDGILNDIMNDDELNKSHFIRTFVTVQDELCARANAFGQFRYSFEEFKVGDDMTDKIREFILVRIGFKSREAVPGEDE